jgi:hypothetical protein
LQATVHLAVAPSAASYQVHWVHVVAVIVDMMDAKFLAVLLLRHAAESAAISIARADAFSMRDSPSWTVRTFVLSMNKATVTASS